MDMVGQPPVQRLDIKIPAVTGIVTMAIKTSFGQNRMYICRYGVDVPDIIRLIAFRFVSLWMNKLDDN
jgi:hypothetical protein